MTKEKILAGNWKMHKTREEAKSFFSGIGNKVAKSPFKKIVAPSPTLLESCVKFSEGTGIQIFSQNVAYKDQGAFTGEISPLQLKDIGIKGTLIGHSERRQFFGDTDDSCAKRAACALEHDLFVIYCIGENLEERKAGKTFDVLKKQIAALRPLGLEYESDLIFAYEPVWAIGTGLTATTEQIVESHKWIKELSTELKVFERPCLYGGSVKPNNFKEIATSPGVSGGLVGGASLEVQSFLDLHSALLA